MVEEAHVLSDAVASDRTRNIVEDRTDELSVLVGVVVVDSEIPIHDVRIEVVVGAPFVDGLGHPDLDAVLGQLPQFAGFG